MSADPLCLCGHPASTHAAELEPLMCYVCGCQCREYWMATRPPQPPPNPGKAAVWPLVIEDARAACVLPTLLHDMRERDEFGRRKYGGPLATHNGRRALEDLYDELLDAVAYAFQWAEEATDRVERARRWRLYRLALWFADTLCAERQAR